MPTFIETPEEFARLRDHLHSLMDVKPQVAIAEARQLGECTFFSMLKAGVLVDAGAAAKDKDAITEGIAIFRTSAEKNPRNGRSHYNLANGLIALTDAIPYSDAGWYLTTAEQRRDARRHFALAGDLSGDGDTAARAYTNLGNAFGKAFRWSEAYDSYKAALLRDPTNGIALTGAAKVLLRCIKNHIGDADSLREVAARYLRTAKEHQYRISEVAGQRALEELSKLLEHDLRGGEMPDLTDASPYERFVAKNRLALSPTIEGLNVSLSRWDSLRILSIIESTASPAGAPIIFPMFNVIKADYLAARYIAFQALSENLPDSGLYSDTLDYARYGIVPSMLTLAQRSCFDLLDKIAVATTEYFHLNDPKREVSFSTRWFEKPKPGMPFGWHPSLVDFVKRGNYALIALGELALDMSNQGALHPTKSYRDASTHRFTILHDIVCTPHRQSSYVEHSGMSEFTECLLETLRLTRSALLYFVEMIAIEEAAKERAPGIRVPLVIPNHHDIRGDDSH